MNNFIKKLEDKLLPIASFFGNQRHLLVIRDSFSAIMPLMIIGALAVAINNLPIPAFQNLMNSVFKYTVEDGTPIWQNVGGAIWDGSFGIMAILMSYLIGNNLGESYGMNGKISGAIALASFVTIGGMAGTDSAGLFIAIIVALLAVELLRKFSEIRMLQVRMPEGVPPAVSDAFNNMFPMMLVITVFALATTLLLRVGIPNIIEAFYTAVQIPFMGLTSTLPAAIALAFVPSLFWFFGIHGANMIDPFMQLINAPAIEANATAILQGKEAPNIVNKAFFDSFVNMGGTGVTIALIVGIFLVARKNKKLMTIASLSAAPGIFNINEPLLFGLPMVLNPIFFIPYVFGPVIASIVAYTATTIGLVPAATVVIPWVTPPIIGGFIATQSWQGGLLALLNLVIMVLIYIPFIILQDKQDAKDAMNEI